RRGSPGRRLTAFLQYVGTGLTVGSFYALLALGYTIVYGIVRIINFAHADLAAAAAFAGWAVVSTHFVAAARRDRYPRGLRRRDGTRCGGERRPVRGGVPTDPEEIRVCATDRCDRRVGGRRERSPRHRRRRFRGVPAAPAEHRYRHCRDTSLVHPAAARRHQPRARRGAHGVLRVDGDGHGDPRARVRSHRCSPRRDQRERPHPAGVRDARPLLPTDPLRHGLPARAPCLHSSVGAYTSSLLMIDHHWPFLATLPAAMLTTACSGVVIGYTTLRLRSDYLAIVTLGFGEMTPAILQNSRSSAARRACTACRCRGSPATRSLRRTTSTSSRSRLRQSPWLRRCCWSERDSRGRGWRFAPTSAQPRRLACRPCG